MKKRTLPNRDWLARQYLLPPSGLGRSCPDIGEELGVSKYTVQRWVKTMGLWQSATDRRVFMRKGKPTHWIKPPSKAELVYKYQLSPNGLGMTLEELADDYGVSLPTIRKWLSSHDLMQTFEERHSERMSGKGNPAYKNGNSHRYVKRQLTEIKPKVCEWCGATKRIQVHHIDHDTENNELENLMWLCGPCNRLEAQLWQLQQANRVKVKHLNNRLVIEFLGDKEL
jgi:transposase